MGGRDVVGLDAHEYYAVRWGQGQDTILTEVGIGTTVRGGLPKKNKHGTPDCKIL